MGDKRKRLLRVNIDRRVKKLYNWITKVHKIQSKQPGKNDGIQFEKIETAKKMLAKKCQ